MSHEEWEGMTPKDIACVNALHEKFDLLLVGIILFKDQEERDVFYQQLENKMTEVAQACYDYAEQKDAMSRVRHGIHNKSAN